MVLSESRFPGETMDYEHDLFISYCRVGETQKWLSSIFVPLLEEQLHLSLGRKPNIYFDDQIRSGGTWPVELGQALGRSRALLALWSRPFLNSDWCAREVATMRAREHALNLRTAQNPSGVISISVIHNGPPPEGLAEIQYFEIAPFYNTRMRPDSALMEAFNDRLREEADDLAAVIENAPPFDPAWPTDTAAEFFEAFRRPGSLSQTTNPRYTEQ